MQPEIIWSPDSVSPSTQQIGWKYFEAMFELNEIFGVFYWVDIINSDIWGQNSPNELR